MYKARLVVTTALALTLAGVGCDGPRKRAEKPAGTNTERGKGGATGQEPTDVGTGGTPGTAGAGGSNGAPADASSQTDASSPLDVPESMDGEGTADLPSAPTCGNGVVESGEECDPPGSCPAACPNQGCTRFVLQGTAAMCTARCVEVAPQTACMSGDGCCPASCNATNDSDCAIKCDNGIKEGQETCDPLSSCPSACPAAGCQLRRLVNPGTCTAACVNDRQQTTCAAGDGCCPPACNATNDSDCQPKCGNGAIESGETCDPVSQCSSRRDACTSNRDTVRTRTGDASRCTFRCDEMPRPCGPGDGQCPTGCGASQDSDCKRPDGQTCGTPGECVSGNCVGGVCCNTPCNDGCRSCRISGKVGTCSPPSGSEIACDGQDNNCDGRVDENCGTIATNPPSWDFGEILVGQLAGEITVSVDNNGPVPLRISLRFENPSGCEIFADPEINTCDPNAFVAPGDSCFADIFMRCRAGTGRVTGRLTASGCHLRSDCGSEAPKATTTLSATIIPCGATGQPCCPGSMCVDAADLCGGNSICVRR